MQKQADILPLLRAGCRTSPGWRKESMQGSNPRPLATSSSSLLGKKKLERVKGRGIHPR